MPEVWEDSEVLSTGDLGRWEDSKIQKQFKGFYMKKNHNIIGKACGV